ncbi:MAG: hypothetical protein WCW44_04060 [archaeon]|jgi:hypothetical protein
MKSKSVSTSKPSCRGRALSLGQGLSCAPFEAQASAQGTVEYLVIIGVVVVLSLVVVGLISSTGSGSAGTISSASGQISQTSGAISISEAVIDVNGRGYIAAGNNTGAGLTITGINVDGKEVNTRDTDWSSFGKDGFLLDDLGSACSCDGFVGQTKTCEIIFYGTSEYGIDHNYKISTTITCISALDLADENVVVPIEVPIIRPPIVSLLSPVDGNITVNGIVEFNFAVASLDANVLDCNLKINSNLDANHILINSLLLSDTNYSINYSLPSEGDYNWNVTCYTAVNSASAASDRNISYHIPISPVLFSDNFDSGTIDSNWNLWRFQFGQSSGSLNVVSASRVGFNYGHWGNGRSATIMTHIGDTNWTSYTMEVDYENLAVGSFNPHWIPSCYRGSTFAFRTVNGQESWNSPVSTGYSFSLQTADCPGSSTKGEWGFGRSHDYWIEGTGYDNPKHGVGVSLASGNIAAYTNTGINHIKIEVDGNRTRVTVNGHETMDFNDTVYGAGEYPLAYGGVGMSWGWETVGKIYDINVTQSNITG